MGAWLLCNGLPHNDPGFNSRCKNRALHPLQDTVNGGAVSKWPFCRWDFNKTQPTNQPCLSVALHVATTYMGSTCRSLRLVDIELMMLCCSQLLHICWAYKITQRDVISHDHNPGDENHAISNSSMTIRLQFFKLETIFEMHIWVLCVFNIYRETLTTKLFH